MTEQEDQLAGQIYRHLSEENIVGPDHAFYVRIWEDSDVDPVYQLRKHIRWSEVESLQLFSGFAGSGKTTQLRRIKADLEAEGYYVILSDAGAYLNLGEPTDITDLIIAIAGALSDGLPTELAGTQETYWSRLKHYLAETKVKIPEANLKLGDLEFKAELSTDPSFRQQMRGALTGRVAELRRQAHAFAEECVKALWNEFGDGKRVVLLFDSLEKLKGSPANEEDVMKSVESVFRNYLEFLRLPYVHCVYSVPPWLPFVISYKEIRLIPGVRLGHRHDGRARDETNWALLRQLVRVRFGPSGWAWVFGEGEAADRLTDPLIEMCGGSVRDLLLLFRTLVLNARKFPATERSVRAAITQVRNDFRTNAEDARLMRQILDAQSVRLESPSHAELARLQRLVDNHFVLYFRNDENWYDVHPLIRPEVDRLAPPAAS